MKGWHEVLFLRRDAELGEDWQGNRMRVGLAGRAGTNWQHKLMPENSNNILRSSIVENNCSDL